MVIRVDRENGYIDLSKKRVPKGDNADVQSRFAKGKMV
jgi:translation initiation factor 2 alpha subunit (eIF-2alpha)